jgi:hypothetical protein
MSCRALHGAFPLAHLFDLISKNIGTSALSRTQERPAPPLLGAPHPMPGDRAPRPVSGARKIDPLGDSDSAPHPTCGEAPGLTQSAHRPATRTLSRGA